MPKRDLITIEAFAKELRHKHHDVCKLYNSLKVKFTVPGDLRLLNLWVTATSTR